MKIIVIVLLFLLASVVNAQAKKPLPKKAEPKKEVPKKKEDDQNLIGIQLHYLANSTPVGKVNPISAGGGLQFEPDFMHISDSMRMGYILEYTRSTGEADYKMVNNILYLQYRYKSSKYMDFYGNLGVGVSYINFKGKKSTSAPLSASTTRHSEGADPMLMTEIGWQGLKFDDYMIRVGIRGNGIFEKYRSFGNVGLQVSVLRSF